MDTDLVKLIQISGWSSGLTLTLHLQLMEGWFSPHLPGVGRTYGTRVGAYDNTAGTAMVLTVAEAMANFNTAKHDGVLFVVG